MIVLDVLYRLTINGKSVDLPKFQSGQGHFLFLNIIFFTISKPITSPNKPPYPSQPALGAHKAFYSARKLQQVCQVD